MDFSDMTVDDLHLCLISDDISIHSKVSLPWKERLAQYICKYIDTRMTPELIIPYISDDLISYSKDRRKQVREIFESQADMMELHAQHSQIVVESIMGEVDLTVLKDQYCDDTWKYIVAWGIACGYLSGAKEIFKSIYLNSAYTDLYRIEEFLYVHNELIYEDVRKQIDEILKED